jgi:hypothetical protein
LQTRLVAYPAYAVPSPIDGRSRRCTQSASCSNIAYRDISVKVRGICYVLIALAVIFGLPALDGVLR